MLYAVKGFDEVQINLEQVDKYMGLGYKIVSKELEVEKLLNYKELYNKAMIELEDKTKIIEDQFEVLVGLRKDIKEKECIINEFNNISELEV